jgi:hypothetical protein
MSAGLHLNSMSIFKKRVISVTHDRVWGVVSSVVWLVEGRVQLKPFRQVWVGQEQLAIDHSISIARTDGFVSNFLIVPSSYKKAAFVGFSQRC